MTESDRQGIVQRLIEGVAAAVPKGGTEMDVVTHITRPLWQLWCEAMGDPPDTEPTPWIGKDTKRVFGSLTLVYDRPGYSARSLARALAFAK